MREQIRLWFYSQLFMSVVITGKAPFRSVLGYEKMLDETGREMHGSWGNLIKAEEAFQRMGADVMRYQFCAQPPDRNLLFGYGPAHEVRRRLLTLWNSVRFLVDYANIEGWRPTYDDLASGPSGDLRPLDRWMVARAGAFATEATEAFEQQLTHRVMEAFEVYLDDLSNWYIRRSRRRFYDGDEAAFRTLWYAIVQGLRGVAVVMPFVTEHLWANLVAGACEDAPASVHLAGWPEPAGTSDEALLDEVAEVRRVVALGRRARDAASLKLRQPLRRLVVQGAGPAAAHEDEIRDELRVKEVSFGPVEAVEVRVKPNLPVLGPRLGAALREVRAALQEGRFEQLDGGRFRVNGYELGPDEVLVERSPREGWALAEEDGLTVAVETTVDDELAREGRLLDLIHLVNVMRRDAGLELTDRIRLVLPRRYDELRDFEGRLRDETLAVEVSYDDADEPRIDKAA
jgi:isoleucyl-tRNA synthetase